jgi:hypothetical protein
MAGRQISADAVATCAQTIYLPGYGGPIVEELPGADPPEALNAEVARAWGRREWMAAQKEEVRKLLTTARLYPREGNALGRKPFEEFMRRTFGVLMASTTALLSKDDIPTLVAEYLAVPTVHSRNGFVTWVRQQKHRSGHRSELREGFNKDSGIVTRRGPGVAGLIRRNRGMRPSSEPSQP